MADQEQVLAEARQAMVGLVLKMKRFMDSHPQREAFNQLMDRSVPGMRAQLEQTSELSDAVLTKRIQATQPPGWEDRTAQMIRIPGHPPEMFADPAVSAAVGPYIRAEEGVRALNLAAGAPLPRGNSQTRIGHAPVAGYDTARAKGVLDALERRSATPPARPATARPSSAPAGPLQQPQQPGPTATPPPGRGPAGPTPTQQPRQQRPSQSSQPTPPSRPQPAQASRPQPQQPQPAQPQAGQPGRPQAVQPGGPQVGQPGQPSRPGAVQQGSAARPVGGVGSARSQQGVGRAAGAAGVSRPDRSPAADGRDAPRLNVDLMGTAGSVVVRADADCRRPTMTIRTAATPDSLQPSAQPTDARSGGPRVVLGDHRGVSGGRASSEIVFNGDVEFGGSVVLGDQSGVAGGTVIGDVVMSGRGGFEISGGGLHISGSEIGTVDIGPGTVKIDSISNGTVTVSGAASPIEVTAVVPEGTSVRIRTELDIATEGPLDKVDVKSERGNVVVNRADRTASANTVDSNPGRANSVIAKSVRGNVTVENAGGNVRAEAADGDVTVNATAPGDVKVGSLSGKVTVTASSPQVAEQLKVHDADGRGEVPVTLRETTVPSRGSNGERDYNGAGRTGQQRQTGNTLGA